MSLLVVICQLITTWVGPNVYPYGENSADDDVVAAAYECGVVGDIAGRITLERMRRDVFCRRLCLSGDYLLDNNDKSEICLLAPMLTYQKR